MQPSLALTVTLLCLLRPFPSHNRFTLAHIPLLLLLVPQMTPCTPNPSLLPFGPPPPSSWSIKTHIHKCPPGTEDQVASCRVNHKIPHFLWKYLHPGNDSLTGLSKHYRMLLQVSNNSPFTFSWGLPGQPSPLSSSLHGWCKLPDRCLAAWSISHS